MEEIEESLRQMAWQRAKGELYSISCASRSRGDEYKRKKAEKLSELITEFIKSVEDNGLQE